MNTTTYGFTAEQANQVDSRLAAVQDGVAYNIVDRSFMAVMLGAEQRLLQSIDIANAPTTTPSISIAANGNVGIGTTTAAAKLTVDGSVFATSYEAANMPGTAFMSGSVAGAAEMPAAVLTAAGNVDLYKLATYSLAGVQALAEKVDAHEVRLTSLEDRVAKLESGAISTASGSPSLASSTEQLAGWLANAGNGIGDLFAKAFHASEKICVDDQCLTKDDVKNLLALVRSQTASVPADQTPPADTTAPATTTATNTPENPVPAPAPAPDLRQGVALTYTSDVEPPVVTLTGAAAMQITVGDTFTDPGATATDNVDGDLTTHIIVSGTVDATTAGLYELTYSATDAAGNTGSASRVVTVVAPPPAPADTSTTTL